MIFSHSAGFHTSLQEIGEAVLGQHSLHVHVEALQPAQRPQQEAFGGVLLLIRQHFDTGELGSVVNHADVDALPAGLGRFLATISRDRVSGLFKATRGGG